MHYESSCVKNQLSGLVWGGEQVARKKICESKISSIYWEAITLNFGTQGDIANLITYVKFHINHIGGLRVLTRLIWSFSVDLPGRPSNSVSTIVLCAAYSKPVCQCGLVGVCSCRFLQCTALQALY